MVAQCNLGLCSLGFKFHFDALKKFTLLPTKNIHTDFLKSTFILAIDHHLIFIYEITLSTMSNMYFKDH